MANETILIVDADTKSQKVLEVSFKKAGYRVVMTDGPARASELVQDVSPDIIISDTQFPGGGDGFEFLADVKQGNGKSVPFIFLTEERALPQKMKGFELGADDYLTKPIYIKEVTTRVELLLQKRAKEQLTEQDVEEIEGDISDITMIDLLQTIEEELRSGTIHLTRENQSAVIYFREGNILDAICGKLQGEEAIYRLMLWPDGEFVLRYHEQVRRVDRIEKDSGALLMEGIRRLDQYNELADDLPSLAHVLEADYHKLAQVVDELPTEVARVMRLFDGHRTIREVTDGSPLDDVTTLRIVAKLIEDEYLADVTPVEGKSRQRKRSRSNLAAWLEGVRTPDGDTPAGAEIGREDTSPKFGSSISDMVENRAGRTTSPQSEAPNRRTLEGTPRSTRGDTDNFLAQSKENSEEPVEPVRRTMPLSEGLDNIHELPDESDVAEGVDEDGRRRTALQWERPRSDWKIHLDPDEETSEAAIREIEEEERKRREEEAKHIADVTREATLRFAPTVDRDDHGQEATRALEEDERRRRRLEAEHLEKQTGGMEPVEAPEAGEPEPEESRPRRRTQQLPSEARIPEMPEEEEEDRDDTDELYGHQIPSPNELRERKPTPLSSPASVTLDESSSGTGGPGVEPDEDAGETKAAGEPDAEGSLADSVSESEVFEDSDEVDRSQVEEEAYDERETKDIRPPAELTPLGIEGGEPEVTPELQESDLRKIGLEETDPGFDEEGLQEISSELIEPIEPLPDVQRWATDQEVVSTEYDLAKRSTTPPSEIEGRIEESERHSTMELDATEGPRTGTSAEQEFFDDGSSGHDYLEDLGGESDAGLGAWPIALIIVAALLVVAYVAMSADTEDATAEDEVVQIDAPPKIEPPPPVEPVVPEEPPAPAGLDELAATGFAAEYGDELHAESAELALTLSGNVFPPDAGLSAAEPDAGTTEEPVIATVEPTDEPPSFEPADEPPPPPPQEPAEEQKAPATKVTKATKAKIREAERLVQRERYNDAVKLLRQLSQADPDNGNVAYLHGLAAFNSNRTGEAVKHLARAERLGHRTADLYLHLGAAYNVDKKKSQAKWAYEKFLQLQPEGRVSDEVRTILSTQF